MVKDIRKCLYCEIEMVEVKTKRKQFCSDLCRVKFNQERKFEKQLTELLDIPELEEERKRAIKELMDFGKANLPTKERLLEILNKISENNKPQNKAKIEGERNGVANDTKKEIKQPLTVSEMDDKPIRSNYTTGMDYSIALEEWKEKQNATK